MPDYSHTESIQLIAAIKRLLNVQSNLQSSLLRVTVKRQSDSKMHIDIVFGWSFVALFSFRLFANNQITPFYSILSSQKVGTFDVSCTFVVRACFTGIGAIMWHRSRTRPGRFQNRFKLWSILAIWQLLTTWSYIQHSGLSCRRFECFLNWTNGQVKNGG